MKNQQRTRLIIGLAYNQLIRGPRSTNRCRVEAMNDPDKYYYDEAIRMTADEMEDIDLVGLPLCHTHNRERIIGTIMDHWIDEEGLRIMAEITDDTIIDEIDQGKLAGLSVGYTSEVNKFTGEVMSRTFHEISACEEPFFEKCQINVLASKNPPLPKNGFEIRILKVEASGPPTSSQRENINVAMSETAEKSSPDPMEVEQPTETPAPTETKPQETPSQVEQKTSVQPPSKSVQDTSIVQRFASTLEENKQLREMLAEFQAEKEKQRQSYAQERAPLAAETTDIYRELLKEKGLEMTEKDEALIQQLITRPEGGVMGEIQVTAARAIADLKKRSKTLEEENKSLKDEQKRLHEVFSQEANVDRDYRRIAKVASRAQNASGQQAQATAAAADEPKAKEVPSWFSEILQMHPQKGYSIPTRVAKKVTAAPAAAAAAAAAPTATAKPSNVEEVSTVAGAKTATAAPKKNFATPLPGVAGAPLNPFSFRNLNGMSDIYQFLNGKTINTDRMYTNKKGQRIGALENY